MNEPKHLIHHAFVRVEDFKLVEIIQVIKTRLTKRGSGQIEEDPIRVVEQFWDTDGNLIGERDTFTPGPKTTTNATNWRGYGKPNGELGKGRKK